MQFLRVLSVLGVICGVFSNNNPSDSHVLARRNSTGLTDAVTWDSHSLFILGQRVFILSAEFHPWRLPNPELWSDIFQKIRANGFNTVSFCVNQALHYPSPGTNNGTGDFQTDTYRDIQRFIDEAKNAGLWLIARPGPYINAETTGGGFPGWVGNIAGSLRTDNPNYTQTWLPYMNTISKLIARNQVSNGGPIILVQAENEYTAGADHSPYMQDIIDTYRANGITVPITQNDQHAGAAGNFSPDLPGTGRVNIYCGDTYPQGSSGWAQQSSVPCRVWGGFLLGWGAVATGGTGYEKYSNDLTDASYEDVFYKDSYAQTTTIQNVYMVFGGTNWGQTMEPTVYSSYDYGGGINENRVAGPKMNEMRLQGLFLRVSRDLLAADLLANGTNYTTSSLIHTYELRNSETSAAFYVVRHDDSTSTALTTTQLNVSTSLGSLLIPKNGSLTLNAEVLTWTTIDKSDYIILYAPEGQTGESLFQFHSEHSVNLTNAPAVAAISTNDTVTLNYQLGPSKYVSVNTGGRTIVVLLLSKETAGQWHVPVIPSNSNFGEYFSVGTNQSVLVGGPYIVRSAAISGNTLSLTGDLNGTTTLDLADIPWFFHCYIGGYTNSCVTIPGAWKVSGSLPEINTDFDDSGFVTADLTATNYTDLHHFLGNMCCILSNMGFMIPNNTLRVGQDNVLTVLQDHMGIVETSTNGGKEPRGIRGYAIIGSNTTFSTWKLTGNQGSAQNAPDSFRGYLNEGGLYAERIGAHLPGFPDSSWQPGTPLSGGGVKGAGVNFFRTTFDLHLPEGADVPIRLSFTPSSASSNFRVQIYLNGWQLGKYINNIGPQTIYVLPAGILRTHSSNTLALSLWSLDSAGASIAGLELISDGSFSTALQIEDYTKAPDFAAQSHLRPAAQFVQPIAHKSIKINHH
ncbi:putative beta-galactosidase A [Grifola frondosa]|uniref:Beta-galactosidase n=1 Tax=Grifola frondosa TaxID=5627 RepID=A0A1C7M438_GRIFR|nr:putative beta-galactosidase A [Grifola frondosa]